jgi:hypothetical protein
MRENLTHGQCENIQNVTANPPLQLVYASKNALGGKKIENKTTKHTSWA